jgi:hypothetical protein
MTKASVGNEIVTGWILLSLDESALYGAGQCPPLLTSREPTGGQRAGRMSVLRKSFPTNSSVSPATAAVAWTRQSPKVMPQIYHRFVKAQTDDPRFANLGERVSYLAQLRCGTSQEIRASKKVTLVGPDQRVSQARTRPSTISVP